MNIECPHFSILQDLVTSHVWQSITVLTVAHQAPQGLAVLLDIKKLWSSRCCRKSKDSSTKHTCTAHVSACRNAHNNKENKSTCTCLTKAHTTKVIQRKSWRENEASLSSQRVLNSLKHAFPRTAQRLTLQWEQWQKVSCLWRYTLHTSLRGSTDSISVAKPIEKIIIIIMNFTLVI